MFILFEFVHKNTEVSIMFVYIYSYIGVWMMIFKYPKNEWIV